MTEPEEDAEFVAYLRRAVEASTDDVDGPAVVYYRRPGDEGFQMVVLARQRQAPASVVVAAVVVASLSVLGVLVALAVWLWVW